MEFSLLNQVDDGGKNRGQEADDDGLTLNKRHIADDERPRGLFRLHIAEISLSGESRGQRHLEVALEAEKRRDEDEELVNDLENLPVLDDVEDEAGRDHSESGDDEGEEDLKGDPDKRSGFFFIVLLRISEAKAD